jgi:hypothetical protein
MSTATGLRNLRYMPEYLVTSVMRRVSPAGVPQVVNEDVMRRVMTTSWLNERKTGIFMRSISFALAVDSDGVQAKLKEGLLMILVRNKDTKLLKDKEIYIKSD